MKIFRSILAIVLGAVVAVGLIFVAETVNFIIHGPEPEKPLMERFELADKMSQDPQAMKEWIESLPIGAMAMLQVAWAIGAFFGGGVAALIAGRGRLVHAGIIGALVLAATVVNVYQMKAHCDYTHPTWLVATGVLLPIPLALAAGAIVSKWRDG